MEENPTVSKLRDAIKRVSLTDVLLLANRCIPLSRLVAVEGNQSKPARHRLRYARFTLSTALLDLVLYFVTLLNKHLPQLLNLMFKLGILRYMRSDSV